MPFAIAGDCLYLCSSDGFVRVGKKHGREEQGEAVKSDSVTTTLEGAATVCLLALMCMGLSACRTTGPQVGASSADAVCDVVLSRQGTNTVDLHVALRTEDGEFVSGVTVGPLGPT